LIQAGFAGRNSGNIADCGFGALACAGPEMPNPVRGDFGHGERVLLKPAVRQRQKRAQQPSFINGSGSISESGKQIARPPANLLRHACGAAQPYFFDASMI
jgi:hypothetical protein